MTTLTELSSRLGDKWRILVFGRFKTGKTVGAATFPRPRIIELDPQGEESLVNPQLEAKYGFSKNVVDVFIPKEDKRNARGVPMEFVSFDQCCNYFDESMKKPDTFDTWVLDSATSLIKAATAKAAILLAGGNAFTKKPISYTWQSAKDTGLFLPKLQDFGAERSMTEQFVDMLLDSDKNVIVICHEKEVWEGEGADAHMTEVVPLLTGQSVDRIPVQFSEIYNLRSKKEGAGIKRYLQTQPDGLRACGSRRGIPNETEWTYSAITAALKTIQQK